MDVAKVGQLGVILLAPALAFGAAIHVPRAVGALCRLVRERAARRYPHPAGPPIEQLATDLRRLLRQHDTIRRSTGVTMRAHHLWAIEGAITDCAVQAARALGVPHPERPTHGALSTPELRRLLRALADAGLVLPSGAGLLGADR
jgi:hypothetical protein